MALTATQIAQLNSADEANRLAALGTLVASLEASSVVRGSYTAVAGDATADVITIDSGLTAIVGWQVQILRSGVDVTGDIVMTASDGDLVLTESSTYVITADDVVNYVIW